MSAPERVYRAGDGTLLIPCPIPLFDADTGCAVATFIEVDGSIESRRTVLSAATRLHGPLRPQVVLDEDKVRDWSDASMNVTTLFLQTDDYLYDERVRADVDRLIALTRALLASIPSVEDDR